MYIILLKPSISFYYIIYITKYDKDVTPVIGLSHVIVTQSYNYYIYNVILYFFI